VLCRCSGRVGSDHQLRLLVDRGERVGREGGGKKVEGEGEGE